MRRILTVISLKKPCVRVKVHMAVNTLISDDELPTALKVAEDSYKLGVDAFIIQDLGLADIIKNACPEITLHASTQMGVHTPGAAKLLYSLGFERVVLAREMSIPWKRKFSFTVRYVCVCRDSATYRL